MHNIHPPNPLRQESCPVCGSPLTLGALQCESCGTDLSRSGVLFSTQVKPTMLPHRHLKLKLPRRVKPSAAVLIALVLLCGLGGVPAVSARVPVLGTLYGRTFGGLLGGTPATPSPGAWQPSSTFLLVRSTPAGAQVLINDRPVGITPLTIDLAPGTYHVSVSREGYGAASRQVEVGEGPLTVDVSLGGEPEARVPPSQATRSPAPAPPARRPIAVGPPLATGTRAPALALKDRLGVIHRLEPSQGHKTAILFVWKLDDQTQVLIRDLDSRVRKSAGQVGGLVVMMGTDRVTVRSFLSAWQLRMPLVFGTLQVANQYHVSSGVNMLYLVSERGTIEQAQKGTIQPGSVIR